MKRLLQKTAYIIIGCSLVMSAYADENALSPTLQATLNSHKTVAYNCASSLKNVIEQITIGVANNRPEMYEQCIIACDDIIYNRDTQLESVNPATEVGKAEIVAECRRCKNAITYMNQELKKPSWEVSPEAVALERQVNRLESFCDIIINSAPSEPAPSEPAPTEPCRTIRKLKK
ncbi:MAG: hypothetical protein WCJ17_00355 [bacterium]